MGEEEGGRPGQWLNFLWNNYVLISVGPWNKGPARAPGPARARPWARKGPQETRGPQGPNPGPVRAHVLVRASLVYVGKASNNKGMEMVYMGPASNNKGMEIAYSKS